MSSLTISGIKIDPPAKNRGSFMVYSETMDPEIFKEVIAPIMRTVKGRWYKSATAYYVPQDQETKLRGALAEYMDQDQRIGVVAARAVRDGLRVAGVQGLQNVVRQDIAGPVAAALQTHEQDVLRADRRSADDCV